MAQASLWWKFLWGLSVVLAWRGPSLDRMTDQEICALIKAQMKNF